jgi:hypothetical protein
MRLLGARRLSSSKAHSFQCTAHPHEPSLAINWDSPHVTQASHRPNKECLPRPSSASAIRPCPASFIGSRGRRSSRTERAWASPPAAGDATRRSQADDVPLGQGRPTHPVHQRRRDDRPHPHEGQGARRPGSSAVISPTKYSRPPVSPPGPGTGESPRCCRPSTTTRAPSRAASEDPSPAGARQLTVHLTDRG